jgi:hypothetical protein
MTEVSAHSAGYEEVPRVWPFNATHKLGPDVRELLSMHCSWCVLDCGEAQCRAARKTMRSIFGERQVPGVCSSWESGRRKKDLDEVKRRCDGLIRRLESLATECENLGMMRLKQPTRYGIVGHSLVASQARIGAGT